MKWIQTSSCEKCGQVACVVVLLSVLPPVRVRHRLQPWDFGIGQSGLRYWLQMDFASSFIKGHLTQCVLQHFLCNQDRICVRAHDVSVLHLCPGFSVRHTSVAESVKDFKDSRSHQTSSNLQLIMVCLRSGVRVCGAKYIGYFSSLVIELPQSWSLSP